MDAPDIAADLDLAVQATLAAGAAVLPFFRRADQEVRYKTPSQPVSVADLRADRLLREFLSSARPGYGWLSEETADAPERSARDRVWIVDPIDGTRSFLSGYPEFGICVGLVERGLPVLGVVFNPATDELYRATVGGGAFRNDERIRVSGRAQVGASMYASRSELAAGEFDPFCDGEEWELRPLGSTAYKMVCVADGRGDVFLSRGPKSEWDVCAPSLIVTEAGGCATDLDGAAFQFNKPDPRVGGVVATNASLHSALLDRIARLPPSPRMTPTGSEP